MQTSKNFLLCNKLNTKAPASLSVHEVEINGEWSAGKRGWQFHLIINSPSLKRHSVRYSSYGRPLDGDATQATIIGLIDFINWGVSPEFLVPYASQQVGAEMIRFINELKEKTYPTISADEAIYGY